MRFTAEARARGLMGVQLLLMGIIFATAFFESGSPESSTSLKWIGVFFFFAGLSLFAWSAVKLGKSMTPDPVPKANGGLRMDGPYRFARHPIYSAVVLCSLGWTIVFFSWISVFSSALLTVVLFLKANWEEAFLLNKYPEYVAYKKRVGRFFPKF